MIVRDNWESDERFVFFFSRTRCKQWGEKVRGHRPDFEQAIHPLRPFILTMFDGHINYLARGLRLYLRKIAKKSVRRTSRGSKGPSRTRSSCPGMIRALLSLASYTPPPLHFLSTLYPPMPHSPHSPHSPTSTASKAGSDDNITTSERMSEAALRKKKNADAQAAFRARRANYIATLEETGSSVPAPLLRQVPHAYYLIFTVQSPTLKP